MRFLSHDSVAEKFRLVAFEEFRLAGFNHYTWCTCQDDKVRPVHRALDGRVFLLDEPHPTEQYPGHAPGCRCVGAPCVDAISTL
ncbi:minor capsid protein, partial [Streptococcus pneumoniae]|uniref:minor capsid protein n=1 Tax=Streptococcus pneumoniae TaxID=1313 RepID=UPI00139B235F|nr:hypothetical protein [Streptococcus pneumoniae]